jgi:signal transduction histidine kinase
MVMFAVLGTSIVYLIHPLAALIVVLMSVLIILCQVLYTKKRYQDIDELSTYLRKIYNGDYTLDIRDNVEGELSILKNEIYKVTLILSKQSELLKKEKEQLANALSDISHQLKTPLTSMTVMADLLGREDLKLSKRNEFTQNMDQQLKRMEWLLSSLLKLSKIDAGTVEFKKDPILVGELVKQAVKPLLIPMELKEQQLVIEGADTVVMIGDFHWTLEALVNIIKNCVEHTGIGGTIRISFDENPLSTDIRISDHGCGIEKEDLPYIFQRFYRGKNAGKDSVGIGLAMAMSITKSQNGDLLVTSHKNQGTQFVMKFYKQVI